MGGGNSHQRRKGSRLNDATNAVVGANEKHNTAAVVPAKKARKSGERSQAPVWERFVGWEALLRWDILAVIVPGVLLAVGIGALPLDWFPHNLLISQICFSLAALLLIIKFGHAWTARDRRLPKVLLSASAAVLILFIAGYSLRAIQVHKSEYRPALSFQASVSLGYPNGTNVGTIKWSGTYQDIRMTINDVSSYPVRSLDLTVQAIEPNESLTGMTQLPGSEIPGVEFFPPKMADQVLRLRGNDGQDYDLHSQDFPGLPLGKEWKMTCAEIPTGVPLKLIISAWNYKNSDIAPTKLRLYGTYEVQSASRTFDATASIVR